VVEKSAADCAREGDPAFPSMNADGIDICERGHFAVSCARPELGDAINFLSKLKKSPKRSAGKVFLYFAHMAAWPALCVR
jgi:hypothetical protein